MTSRISRVALQPLESIDYRGNPPVAVIAAAAEADRLAAAVEAAGCRFAGAGDFSRGLGSYEERVPASALLVSVGEEEAEEAEPLLRHLASGQDRGSFGIVVTAPLPLLDSVHAVLLGSEVDLLCDPSEGELVAAIRAAASPRPARLHDVSKAQATVRLQQLSEEVGRIASVLAALSEDDAAAAAVAAIGGPAPGEEGERLDAGFIRSIIRVRRLRDHFFKSEMFADPAWDMLLDLMAARVEKQRVAVSSLCIAAAVPPTTALRWIKTLCDQGLFVRIADPEDGRRVFIELSDEAAAGMEGYLKSAQRVSSLIV